MTEHEKEATSFWLDPVRAVPEIARVLRPGGRLGIICTRCGPTSKIITG